MRYDHHELSENIFKERKTEGKNFNRKDIPPSICQDQTLELSGS